MTVYDQNAADAAFAFLAIVRARKHGLIRGGPHIDAERAAQVLAACRARGIEPRRSAIVEVLRELIGAVVVPEGGDDTDA